MEWLPRTMRLNAAMTGLTRHPPSRHDHVGRSAHALKEVQPGGLSVDHVLPGSERVEYSLPGDRGADHVRARRRDLGERESEHPPVVVACPVEQWTGHDDVAYDDVERGVRVAGRSLEEHLAADRESEVQVLPLGRRLGHDVDGELLRTPQVSDRDGIAATDDVEQRRARSPGDRRDVRDAEK